MKIILKIRAFILKQITDIKTYGIREMFRKFYLLIKILTKIPIYIVAVVLCIAIRLISPWIIIRMQELPADSMGALMWFTSLYYCKKKLNIDQLKKKHIDFFYIVNRGTYINKQAIKMWKRKLGFFPPGYLFHPIVKVNSLIPGGKIHIIAIFNSKKEKDIDNLLDKYLPLDFTADEEIYGKKMLNKFGLKDGDKFVCLAVRDREFNLRQIPSRFRDWSYHEYRHYDIDNFALAAEELTKRGYYVFRMGVFVEKSFNLNNPKIIDYANTNLRSDFMDVYLGAKCSFCISTSFGFDGIPYIFRRPIALFYLPFGDIPSFSDKFLIMTKHFVLKKEKRKLSLSEIFSHGVAYVIDSKIYEQKGIELVNNTPDEIKDLAVEMAENLEFKKQLSPEDIKLQNTFKSLFVSNIKRFDHRNESHYSAYNKLHGQIRARFSTKFLRNNKHWLR